MDAVHPLNYASAPSAAHRYLRQTYRFVLLAALFTAAILWAPGIWRWADYLHWQQRCLSYQRPASHVVYEWNAGTTTQYESATFGPLGRFDTPIFLHHMRRPDGRDCMIYYGLQPDRSHPAFPFVFAFTSYDQWGRGEYRASQELQYPAFPVALPEQSHWKFFAGQPDANDPSHFTFDFVLDGQRHTCDAWLNNSGNLIVSPRP
jgi:hypothetical protein